MNGPRVPRCFWDAADCVNRGETRAEAVPVGPVPAVDLYCHGHDRNTCRPTSAGDVEPRTPSHLRRGGGVGRSGRRRIGGRDAHRGPIAARCRWDVRDRHGAARGEGRRHRHLRHQRQDGPPRGVGTRHRRHRCGGGVAGRSLDGMGDHRLRRFRGGRGAGCDAATGRPFVWRLDHGDRRRSGGHDRPRRSVAAGHRDRRPGRG